MTPETNTLNLNPNLPTPELPANSLTSLINTGYYRSRIYNLSSGSNRLIAAAAPLFSIVSKLKNREIANKNTVLLQELIHELKAFENKAQLFGYRANFIFAARYAICALIDETILKTTWGIQYNWDKENLLQIFEHEPWGGEKFFVILDRAHEDPAINLEILELMYLCLAFGFEGKFSKIERGSNELSLVTNNLYNCITQHRGEISKSLLIKAPVSQPSSLKLKNKSIFWIWLLIIVTTNLVLYGGFNHYLHTQIEQLQNNLITQSNIVSY
jgi:type VI secretion system protein ImpK